MSLPMLGYAIIGGLLPSLIWLYFLLKEDSRHPEPKSLIVLTFVAGMAAVLLALPLEQYAGARLEGNFSIFIAWALIEEFLKYGVVGLLILWRPAVDEAPDYVIYMLTAALGFAAAENALFLLAPIADGHVAAGIVTGNARFLGSSLLHILASSAIGFALAFSSMGRPLIRMGAACVGLILAIALHTAFNILIMDEGSSVSVTAFFLVWSAAVIFFATFEVLKYSLYRTSINTPS